MSKQPLILALFVIVSIATAAQTVTIPAGTAIRIRTIQPLWSDTARVGDDVALEVLDNVAIGEYVLIQQGSPVIGVVSGAKEAKNLGRRGHVALSLKYAESVTGEHVPLSGNRSETGSGKIAKVTTEVMVATAITPLGLLFLFEKGNDSVIPPGTAFTAFAAADTPVNLDQAPKGTKLLRSGPSGPQTLFPLGIVVGTNPHNLFATITGVMHDGPGERAGLRIGYLITSINNVAMHNALEISQAVAALPVDLAAVNIGYAFPSSLGYMPRETMVLLAKGTQ